MSKCNPANVYCNNCRWYVDGDYSDWCKSPTLEWKASHYNCYQTRADPKVKNKNNNCPDWTLQHPWFIRYWFGVLVVVTVIGFFGAHLYNHVAWFQ